MPTDNLDIPDFLRIPAAERAAAWAGRPVAPLPSFRPQLTETQRLYQASIDADKARKRALDEARFTAMREQAQALRAERASVLNAAKRVKR